jgi:diacylglycerol kinase (ATP)
VILNPVAGRGAATSRGPKLLRRLVELGFDYRLLITDGPDSARTLASRSVSEGASMIVAAGGDGTISQVAQALVGQPIPLAILPLGTGNDLARHLGISKPEAAIDVLIEGRTNPVDVIAWKAAYRSGFVVNVAGLGFDAEVAERINRGYRWIGGTAAYLLAVVECLGRTKPLKISLEIDGRRCDRRIMLCAFANASSYGGGMRIAPKACTEDGLIDLIIVNSVSRVDFLRALPGVFRGLHLAHPAVEHLTAKKISVICECPAPILCDGEIVAAGSIEFEIRPRALNLVRPQVALGR